MCSSDLQMAALVNAVKGSSPGQFFKGYSGVSNLPSGWMSPIYANSTSYFDVSNFNHNNLFYAMGSDGKLYPQIPAFDVKEDIDAGYLRLDFDTSLFGYEINGNFGGRYTRTRDCFDDFVDVLSQVDVLMLLDVYSAGEAMIEGADSRSLARTIRTRGQVEPIMLNINDMDQIRQVLGSMLKANDLLITQGAGNVGQLCLDLAKNNLFLADK